MILVTGGSGIISSTFIKINILGIFRLFWFDKRFFANLDCEQKSYKQTFRQGMAPQFFKSQDCGISRFQKKDRRDLAEGQKVRAWEWEIACI